MNPTTGSSTSVRVAMEPLSLGGLRRDCARPGGDRRHPPKKEVVGVQSSWGEAALDLADLELRDDARRIMSAVIEQQGRGCSFWAQSTAAKKPIFTAEKASSLASKKEDRSATNRRKCFQGTGNLCSLQEVFGSQFERHPLREHLISLTTEEASQLVDACALLLLASRQPPIANSSPRCPGSCRRSSSI